MSGEKRSQDSEDTLLAETTIIVDIEGTTTSISFVKETLFPYVRENLKQYLEKNWDSEEFKADLDKLKEQAKKDETDKVEGFVSITGATPDEERESVAKNVLWQMDGDRKTGALKQLQGHMWREAYKSGAIKGHVYEDVPKAFDQWTKSGRKIYVYSSGSVDAQKLLFGHSEHGDMLKYFTDYFDTEVGVKQESSSYKKILEKIDVQPSSVLFLTDIVKEAEAAKEAGMSTRIVVRPGNGSLTDEEKVTFTTIESFMDLSFQTSAKRQKVEKPEEKEKVVEPEVAKDEPMDTTDDAVAETSVEKPVVEKIDDTKKEAESVKAEEAKVVEKPEVTSMETESKVETEKKTAEVVDDKPTVESEEGKKKNEEESKVSEKTSEKVSEAATESSKTSEESNEVGKKESEVAKANEPAKVESEPMDEDKNDAAPKPETVATLKEDKTETIEKTEPTKPENKIENEAKTTEAVPEAKTKVESAETSSTIVEKVAVSSEVSASAAAAAATETKVEVSSADKTPSVTVAEKTEKETVDTATEKTTVKADEKVAAAAAAAVVNEETKQNGDSVAANNEEKVSSADKTEVNGDAKMETKEENVVVADEAKDPVVPETEKKIAEPIAESAKKEETDKETTKIDESAPVAETTDAKLNGTTENNCEEEKKDDKPHRNGLNGDSSNEKTNGDTKVEEVASAQNGDAECSTGETAAAAAPSASAAAAESIKAKKVVDSTIADGAGEPDVVAPVPVAATS